MDIELAAKQLDALGSPTRILVFRALVRAGHAGMSVRRLQEAVGVPSASTLSHHLQRLITAGLVTQERQATTLICRASAAAVHSLAAFLFEANEAAEEDRPHGPADAGRVSSAD